jgi:hypothetical protein
MPSVVPRFDANVIAAARRLHDKRTDATSSGDTGMRYTSALLAAYQNNAIRDIVRDTYKALGPGIKTAMPEMLSLKEGAQPSSGIVSISTTTWMVLEVQNSAKTVRPFQPLGNADFLTVRSGFHPIIKPSATVPYFTQIGQKLYLLGLTGSDVDIVAVRNHVDIVPGQSTGDDIQLAPMWDSEIIERMAAFGLADAKSSIAVGG